MEFVVFIFLVLLFGFLFTAGVNDFFYLSIFAGLAFILLGLFFITSDLYFFGNAVNLPKLKDGIGLLTMLTGLSMFRVVL